jgi:hypothetical protein
MTTTTGHKHKCDSKCPHVRRRVGGSIGGNQYGKYKVRTPSERQLAFIQKLLATKNHTLGTPDLSQLNVQGASDLIELLLGCDNLDTYLVVATPKQISYLKSLSISRVGGEELLKKLLDDNKATALETLSAELVGGAISTLVQYPEIRQSITETGAYKYNGVVYSIRIGRQSGRWQVYEYSPQDKKWVYYTKNNYVLKKLSSADRLSLNEAIEVSAQTGTCVHCGTTLTALKSVAGGMGKTCAEKYGYTK